MMVLVSCACLLDLRLCGCCLGVMLVMNSTLSCRQPLTFVMKFRLNSSVERSCLVKCDLVSCVLMSLGAALVPSRLGLSWVRQGRCVRLVLLSMVTLEVSQSWTAVCVFLTSMCSECAACGLVLLWSMI